MAEKHCLQDIILIIDGRQVPHSGDGDWYAMDALPGSTVTTGSSGTDIIVCSTDKGTNATISTIPYESAYRFMGELWQRTRAGEGPFSLSYFNPNNGDRHDGNVTLMQAPGQSASQGVSSVPWALRLSDVAENIEFGTAL